jgi:hypothetical protein
MTATDLHLPICYQILVNFSVEKYLLMSGHPVFFIYVYKLWRFCLSTCLHLPLVSSLRYSFSLQHRFQTVLEEKCLPDSWVYIKLFSTKSIFFLKTTTIAAYPDVTNTDIIITSLDVSLANICLQDSQNNKRNIEQCLLKSL